MEKNIHAGHRERLRKKFQQNFNFDNLEEHEILEMLLFYCYRQCNTNDIAHKLIDKFGSINNVLSASYEELVDSKIIGENPALTLKFFNSFNIYLHNQNSHDEVDAFEIPKLMSFVKDTFYGLDYEVMKIYFSDNNYKVKSYTDVGKGVNNSLELKLRDITKAILNNGGNCFFIAHNHPDADNRPSDQDILLTRKVLSHLATMDIHLLDHFIVGNNGIMSMRQEGYIYDYEI